MCRNWFAKYCCGHDTGDANGKLFTCPDHGICGPIVRSEFISKDFCTPCWKSLRAIAGAGDSSRIYALNNDRLHQVRQVLNLAAEPYERFRTFVKEGEFGFVYKYDSTNILEFNGQLSELEGPWIGLLTEFIGRYIAMPDTPELTEGEMRLFDQLRVAELAFSLMDREAELQLQEENAGNRVLQARLRTRMLPVHVPRNNANCPICLKVMSESPGNRNRAVALPCAHVFCLDCLEARVGEWEAGHSFHCCPICGESFDMLTDLEQAEGIDPLNRASLPAAGPWLEVLKSAWNTAPE